MKRTAFIVALLLAAFNIADAKLALRHPAGDGMVLQQQTEAAVWGFASPGATITVTPSWNGRAYRAKADADGHWTAKVDTPAASYKPYTVKVSGDGGTITIKDVLIGEVWIASGQSNMEMPVRGFYNCPVEGYNEVVSQAPARDRIRMFFAHVDQSYEPLEEVRNTDGWHGADPNTIPEMSATAYFFARKANEVLDIPVGIVAIPYGGARVESWLPESTVRAYGTEDLSHEAIDAQVHYLRPFLAYNAMEVPVQGYTARGFIWYQGCSNVGHHEEFVSRMQDLVKQWRSDWGDSTDSMPFYMVEIAPYRYKPVGNGDSGSYLRLAQHEAAEKIPNSGCITTNDLAYSYEADNIHPCQKQPVGERLAYMALNRIYGYSRIACDSPQATEIFRQEGLGSEICVRLSNCPNGLDRWMEIEGLEVCGSEGVWNPVSYAYFEYGGYLRIRCEGVFDPCEVRYGWGDFNPGNLHNAEGLPVTPFWLKLESK